MYFIFDKEKVEVEVDVFFGLVIEFIFFVGVKVFLV